MANANVTKSKRPIKVTVNTKPAGAHAKVEHPNPRLKKQVHVQRNDSHSTMRDELRQIKIHERYGMIASALTIVVAILALAVPLIVHSKDTADKRQQSAIDRSNAMNDREEQRREKAKEEAPRLDFEHIKAQGGPGHFSRFFYAVANQGKAPATGMTMSAQTLVLKRPRSASNEEFDRYAQSQLEAARVDSWVYPDLIGKHSHAGYFDDDQQISASMYPLLLRGDLRVYAIAKVAYPGFEGEKQRADFCVYAFPESAKKGVNEFTVTNCGFREPAIR